MTPSPEIDKDHPLVVSICIPTYNRAALLRRCLNLVLPQIPGRPVEVVVIDNASTDQTPEVVQEFLPKYPGLRYFRNPTNLGYSGGQAKCIEYGRGKYTAILCDDDVYAPNAVETMLPILSKGDFSFVALNYYAFASDPSVVLSVAAPEESFQREDAYEVWDFPSVGHFSGLVFNTSLAKDALPRVWEAFTKAEYEHFRGIFGTLGVYMIKGSNLPGYFIGQPIVGAGRPETVDYDSLTHICIDTYKFLHTMKVKGVLTQQNIQRRQDEILGMLPKALIRHGGFQSAVEFASIRNLLYSWFDGDPRFRKTAFLLSWMRFGIVRALLRANAYAYLAIRQLRRPGGSRNGV
jgi:glycosyltransferase involved in cell wall biosynthesis